MAGDTATNSTHMTKQLYIDDKLTQIIKSIINWKMIPSSVKIIQTYSLYIINALTLTNNKIMCGGVIIKCLITCCAYTPLFIFFLLPYIFPVLVYIILLA